MKIDFSNTGVIITVGLILFLVVDAFVMYFVFLKAKNKPVLTVGDLAPDFNLQATYGRQISLSQYAGKNVVIVFYPADQTPGCTQQLCSLRDDYSQFQSKDTEIIAINSGSIESHEAFANKQNYTYPILVDTGGQVAKAYGVDGPFVLTQRMVFLVNKHGKIAWIYKGIQDNKELLKIIEANQ